MNRSRMPVRMTGLANSVAHWKTMHPQDGELPACFTLDFREVTGPGNLADGRLLRVSITPAELAEVLGAIPAKTLVRSDGDMAAGEDDLRALLRVTRLLSPERE